MRLLIQRVSDAKLHFTQDHKKITKQFVGAGIVVYVGISNEDTQKTIDKAIERILNISLFEDTQEKLKQSVHDRKGSVLLVPNFTLYGTNKKGNQLDFTRSGNYKHAESIFSSLITNLTKKYDGKVQAGKFGSYMQIKQTVDGPVCIILDL